MAYLYDLSRVLVRDLGNRANSVNASKQASKQGYQARLSTLGSGAALLR